VGTDTEGANRYGILCNSGIQYVITGSATGAWVTIKNSCPLNQWQHVVFTYNGSGNVNGSKGYYNGAYAVTGGNVAISGNLYGASGLRFGSHAGGTARFFDGFIDEVRIYNRVLSADEIALLYRMGK
jgi:hypothetical protein